MRIVEPAMAGMRARWQHRLTMDNARRALYFAVFLAGCLLLQVALARDVPFVPTPEAVVDEMLAVAKVGPQDVVYDLGSGDGRIVIAAAKKHGARGVGIDIDPQRIKEAKENARKAGVADRVEFRQGDLFKADIKEATVVTLYLLSSVNEHLKPRLLKELKPGTRVVSHAFDMGDWKPVETRKIGATNVYYWVVPER
jgi:SAM-dependent methyltransferase